MQSLSPYSWQQEQWSFFQRQLAQRRLPHGVLLSGQQGIGKWHFAQLMAKYILCQNPGMGLPCGKCRSCQLFEAGTHPDCLSVTPEEAYKPIKIDQIRELSQFIASTSQQGGYQVVILGPVEQLNTNSANALLKNLEEPAGDTVLLMVSHVASLVMPTLRSRCQLIPLPTPSLAQTIQWLNEVGLREDLNLFVAMAANAPLRAKALATGESQEALGAFLTALAQANAEQSADLSIVQSWSDTDLSEIIAWWLQLLSISVTEKYQTEDNTGKVPLSNLGQQFVGLTQQIQQFHPQWLYKFMDRLLLLKQQLLKGANPNKQLLLEDLLLDWWALLRHSNLNKERLA